VELEQALEQFMVQGMRWQSGRTLLELGHLAAASGAQDEAREYLEQALAEFQAVGARRDHAKIEEMLRA
jgi:hypothetical protein